MTAVGDVLELSYGKALKQSERDGGSVPVVGSGGIVGGHSAGITDAPTIVVGRKGSIGSVTWIDGPAWPIDTAYFVKPRREDLDRRWVFWMLKSLRMETMNKSAAVPGLNRDDVYRLSISFPPLPEQRRIAAILDHADALRVKRRRVLAHLDVLMQSVFQKMFDSRNDERVEAGQLMPTMRNGVSPASHGQHDASVLTLTAITRGAFDPAAVKMSAFSAEPPADKRVSSSDFLMCRGNGNKGLVGAGAFSPVDRADLVFPDTVIAGRVDAAKVTLQYLDAAWRQPDVRRQIESVARTTSGIHKVNQKTLSAVTVPVPPLSLQEEFGDRRRLIGVVRSKVDQALTADGELFVSLQSRAFRGEL